MINVIVPDRHVMAVELAKAMERPKRVEVVVEDCNLHATHSGLHVFRNTNPAGVTRALDRPVLCSTDPLSERRPFRSFLGEWRSGTETCPRSGTRPRTRRLARRSPSPSRSRPT